MKTSFPDKVKGLLIDLDGVIYQDNKLIPGALEVISFINQKQLKFRFLTNTTTKTVKQIREKLNSLGIHAEDKNIFSSLSAARNYIVNKRYKNIFPLALESVVADFSDFMNESEKKDAVLVADIGENFNYVVLNKAFQYIFNGADILAAHKNKYWQKNDQLHLDAGGFVALLEYASNKTAKIIGKPEKDFFNLAASDMEMEPHEIIMVGDDIVSDVHGAQNAGMKGVLVKTGKFRNTDLMNSDISPDFVIESIKTLPDLL